MRTMLLAGRRLAGARSTAAGLTVGIHGDAFSPISAGRVGTSFPFWMEGTLLTQETDSSQPNGIGRPPAKPENLRAPPQPEPIRPARAHDRRNPVPALLLPAYVEPRAYEQDLD